MVNSLLSTFKLKDMTLKNRIVMSPMCMYSCDKEDGVVTDWHMTHYESRAVGQVGLIIVEATAVHPQGRISSKDLGIWDDNHVVRLKQLVDRVHQSGSSIGIQLAHAGRKATVDGEIYAPSAIAFNGMKTPKELTIVEIEGIIETFKQGAARAKEAGFDCIEIHAAHGYLINQFLSPLTNKRQDEFGGNSENRYRLLKKVIHAIKEVWEGPLFVRISANEYQPDGLTVEDHVVYAEQMKAQGVDLIDCSSGGVVPATIDVFPGYQITYSENIKNKVGIPTGAVGLITSGIQAQEIVKNGRADLVFIGRELLRNPYWPYAAAKELNVEIQSPTQYQRGWK
ncbi:NADPH dehydrogenase NamA [Bacillus sp. Marseille-P3661]|uniref:NADPH dehydrogenase NamA n=1 Tax=Bacillus sp. Marseille-P3661 TaxID=1936234 RepID=UPI000C8352F8|nr:NADPH dehydrogenase NamA [Bacillus sp. Marseille-P3661]